MKSIKLMVIACIVLFVSTVAMASNQEQLNKELLNAAANGQLKLVEKTIANGADINSFDENGVTPLFKASVNGHTEV